jgi:ATP-dependent Clp protease ATP-binding subunit ClpA
VDLPLSEECKRILTYGAEEANRLGHKHIGTDHLFLGILREQNCFAAQILRERGVSLDQAREWIADPISNPPAHSSGMSLDAEGRWTGPQGLNVDRYSLKAVRAIIFARSEAGKFASSTVEAEHLLLGLLLADQAIAKQLLHSESAVESIRKQIESNTERPTREKTGPVAEAFYLRKSIKLIALHVEKAIANHEFEKARLYSVQEREKREALRMLGEKHGFDPSVTEEPSGRLSDQCQRVLNQGAEEATLLKQRYIGTEHLLLGILREEKSFAADILHESGLQLAQAREEIARWNQEQGGDHV